MKSRRFIVLAVVLTFFIAMVAVSYAETDEDDAVGTIVAISGKMVTVKESTGKEKKLEVKDLKGVKKGDYVVIDDSKIKKINPEKKKGLDLE